MSKPFGVFVTSWPKMSQRPHSLVCLISEVDCALGQRTRVEWDRLKDDRSTSARSNRVAHHEKSKIVARTAPSRAGLRNHTGKRSSEVV